MIREISVSEAAALLAPLGLRIGSWNEIAAASNDAASSAGHRPSAGAVELYACATQLAAWIASDSWVLLQIDNSTFPTEDEESILASVLGPAWTTDGRSYLIEGGDARASGDRGALVSFVHYALLFEWHAHVVSASCKPGQRLGLQDGTAYLWGDGEVMAAATSLIERLAASPRSVPVTGG